MPPRGCGHNRLCGLDVAHNALAHRRHCVVGRRVIRAVLVLDRLPFPKRLDGIVRVTTKRRRGVSNANCPERLAQRRVDLPTQVVTVTSVFRTLATTSQPCGGTGALDRTLNVVTFVYHSTRVSPRLFTLFVRRRVCRRCTSECLRPKRVSTISQRNLLTGTNLID